MSYFEKLNPWCIVRHFPSMQYQIVTRFRHRSYAEAHLQALQRLIPSGSFTIIFDPAMNEEDQLALEKH